MHLLPTPRELLRGRQGLPDAYRQSMVLIRLRRPIRKGDAWEFLRIHLTPAMLAGGEEEFYRVDIAQPHRVLRRPPRCPRCHGATQRIGVWEFFCFGCGLTLNRRPLRGVVRVLIPQDGLERREDGREWVWKLILVLDRRYREEVLAAVYRTAGMLAEQRGWQIF